MSTSALYHLQTIDSEIDARQKRLAEVEAALGESQTVREVRQAHEQAEQSLSAAQKQQRQWEQEAQAQEQKIKQAEEQLYSGRIRNPKEASSLQESIQAMKRHKGALEDNQLDAMGAVESGTQVFAEFRRKLNEVQSAWEAAQDELIGERDRLRSRLAELATTRSKIVATVSSADLNLYNSLRQHKAGRAVAIVQNSRCSICGVTVPTGQVQRIRTSATPVFCSSCARILYLP